MSDPLSHENGARCIAWTRSGRRYVVMFDGYVWMERCRRVNSRAWMEWYCVTRFQTPGASSSPSHAEVDWLVSWFEDDIRVERSRGQTAHQAWRALQMRKPDFGSCEVARLDGT